MRIDKRTEADWYAKHPLGQYLLAIMPAYDKPLFDPAVLSAIIDMRLEQGWVKETEPVVVAGPHKHYSWSRSCSPASVKVIRTTDATAIKKDLFETMKGRP